MSQHMRVHKLHKQARKHNTTTKQPLTKESTQQDRSETRHQARQTLWHCTFLALKRHWSTFGLALLRPALPMRWYGLSKYCREPKHTRWNIHFLIKQQETKHPAPYTSHLFYLLPVFKMFKCVLNICSRFQYVQCVLNAFQCFPVGFHVSQCFRRCSKCVSDVFNVLMCSPNIVASCWHHVGIILASVWNGVGIILASFPHNFGIILAWFWNFFVMVLHFVISSIRGVTLGSSICLVLFRV